ncbi:hypothetical protein TNIN_172841 [Trichonephila inaurata madagascariensis]|uniref:Uncharacterized protein n=1 Tax=Trichonephila inaurata madagascariensis TaxID=2747483 RepID=A0A8X6XZW6_9ARAC|nr:hypothetical protein TNIN_172841 [Trichonephila inaurata madagascariensis]
MVVLTAVTSGAGGGESSLSVSDETCPIPGERFNPNIFSSNEESSFNKFSTIFFSVRNSNFQPFVLFHDFIDVQLNALDTS